MKIFDTYLYIISAGLNAVCPGDFIWHSMEQCISVDGTDLLNYVTFSNLTDMQTDREDK